MNNTYIKVGGDDEWYLIALNTTSFKMDETNFIYEVFDTQGDSWDEVCSSNGDVFKIADLKCYSIEELIVALDIRNCLYRLNLDENTNSCTSDNKRIELNKLRAENSKLKAQLKAIKKLLKNL